jgi:DNA repair protein RadC
MRFSIYKTVINDRQPELVKRSSHNYPGVCQLTAPYTVADFMIKVFGLDKASEEYMYLVSLDIKGRPLGVFEISHGTISSSLVSVREMLIKLLLTGAVGCIVCHNHPSGYSDPSEDDITTTWSMREGCQAVGITFLDHIIVAGDTMDCGSSYYSFREHDRLDK